MLISELYTIYKQHPVVTTDSRFCPLDSIFFALKGDTFDGNAFAEKALQEGCAYAVVDDTSRFDKKTNQRIILVENVLTTLQQLARLHRETLGIPVIAITGTNGKTTTKELVATVLSKKCNTLFTQGNLNNHIGVPLTLLRLKREHAIAVVEMGASHPGEIKELAEIARPDFGLITNVGYAHLEGFGSFENIVSTKGELYDFLRQTNGKAFINLNDEVLTKMASGLDLISYGKTSSVMDDGKNSQGGLDLIAYGKTHFPAIDAKQSACSQTAYKRPFISGEFIDCQPFLSFCWKEQNGRLFDVGTHFVGGYNLWNALAAVTIGRYFDIPAAVINQAIADYVPSNNRSQFKKTIKNELIIDAYNANPNSMYAALENFAETAAASLKKAVILGDMLELGEKSAELHAGVIALLQTYRFDQVLLCGKQFMSVGQAFPCFPHVEAVNAYLEANPLQDYRILIKGSRGIQLEKTIEKL